MKKKLAMGIISAICGLLGCSAQTEGFKSLEVNDFEQAISDTTIIRLDVRTSEEYQEGHIEGAKNIDVLKDDFEQKATTTLPKDKTIAVYCRSGRRSKKASSILAKDGYNVIELNTGYVGWTTANKPVVK